MPVRSRLVCRLKESASLSPSDAATATGEDVSATTVPVDLPGSPCAGNEEGSEDKEDAYS